MGRTTKIATISLPPKMDEKINEIANKEGMTKSELIREALRRYIEEKELQELIKYGREKAIERGITEDQIEDIVDSYRK
ncbi:MAG TPA: ribbon-helix-helix domain-containing protein [bacterium]|nr:ribbon-helix-helix domain-containing protein [bacterium]